MAEEETITEKAVADACMRCVGDIYGASDVTRFLNIVSIDKPLPMRMIAWCVNLHVLPEARTSWIVELYNLCRYYARCLEQYPKEAAVQFPEGNWDRHAKAIGLCRETVEDMHRRVTRMFSVMIYDSRGFRFEEGLEAFGFVAYFVAAAFAEEGRLPLVFGEAIGSFVAKALIRRAQEEPDLSQLGKLARRFAPGALPHLGRLGGNWIRLWFSQLHTPWNTMLIWDHLLWRGAWQSMQFFLVAHARQALEAGVDLSSDEAVYNAVWRATSLVDDVEFVMQENAKSYWTLIWRSICPCLPLFGAFRF